MKAVIIRERGGPDVLDLCDLPDPPLGPSDVRVAIRATALNRADLLQRRGLYGAPPDSPQDIPGLEFAGEVIEAGALVHDVAIGERVFGILGGGGYADQVVTPARMVARIPERLSFEEAAAVPEVFITAHDALVTQAGLVMGERVLIHTIGGGVGTAALQIAKALGATTIGTAGSLEKLKRAQNLGLDIAVDRVAADFAKVLDQRFEGDGVHVILDTVGPTYWEANLQTLARCGRMVLIGLLGFSQPPLRADLILTKRLRIFGSVLRSRPIEEKIAATQAFAHSIVPLLAQGQLQPVVDRVFSLADVRAAHTYMEQNQNFGKIVMSVG